MTQLDLSIILPVYNEEQGVAAVLKAILRVMSQELPDWSYEIIAVDDGSSDDSANRVMQVDAPQIRLVQHPYNIGNGAAIKSGIRQAEGKYILMMDADTQHAPADIPRLLEKLDAYDMVVGARTKSSDSAMHRNIANQIYNWFASYVSGFKIEDLTSGFRAIKAEIAKSFIYLLPNTFSYPTTITLAHIRSGYSLTYIPITAARRVGKSKIRLIRDGSRFLLIILKIATLFSPLRVFVPISLLMFMTGISYGLFKVLFLNSRYGPTSAMLMTISVVIFMVGLVSEQVAQLRFDRTVTVKRDHSSELKETHP